MPIRKTRRNVARRPKAAVKRARPKKKGLPRARVTSQPRSRVSKKLRKGERKLWKRGEVKP